MQPIDQIASPYSLLDELRRCATIQEFEFRSSIPGFGPLVSAFRRFWNDISTKFYVRYAIQQQVEFNLKVINILDELVRQGQRQAEKLTQQITRLDQLENRIMQQEYDRARLGEVLAEYIAEDAREMVELARELNRIQTLINKAARDR